MYVFFFNVTFNQAENNDNNLCFLQILERITSYLHAQDKIRVLISPAIKNLGEGRTNEFAELLKIFLETRALRSQARANESVLQGVVEVLLDEPNSRVPELRLVLDGNKKYGDGRFGFVDIFILPMNTTVG